MLLRTLVLFAALAGQPPKSAYDLGGPCDHNLDGGSWNELYDAEVKGNWAKVVELKKISVRQFCDNDHRWLDLADALLRAGQTEDALVIMSEVRARGTELIDENINSQKTLMSYVHSEQFKATPLGQAFAKRMADASIDRQSRKEAFRAKLAAMPASQKPPKIFVATDSCPGECCSFREWRAFEDGVLVDRPRGTKVVAKFHKGDAVTGITGNDYVEPVPVAVLYEFKGLYPYLPAGDVIFLLDYVAEGDYHYWHQGKVAYKDTVTNVDDECLEPGPKCWAEPIEGGAALAHRSDEWWVKVRLKNGKVGWTKRIVFEGIDHCG